MKYKFSLILQSKVFFLLWFFFTTSTWCNLYRMWKSVSLTIISSVSDIEALWHKYMHETSKKMWVYFVYMQLLIFLSFQTKHSSSNHLSHATLEILLDMRWPCIMTHQGSWLNLITQCSTPIAEIGPFCSGNTHWAFLGKHEPPNATLDWDIDQVN